MGGGGGVGFTSRCGRTWLRGSDGKRGGRFGGETNRGLESLGKRKKRRIRLSHGKRQAKSHRAAVITEGGKKAVSAGLLKVAVGKKKANDKFSVQVGE